MVMATSTVNASLINSGLPSTNVNVAKTVKVTSNGNETFSDVVLDDSGSISGSRKGRVPKRILHFSDGILEEYSTEEDDEKDSKNNETALLDTKSMTWIPYLWYLAWWFGSKALAACDYMGEHLASFFGITTPKYQFEIDQYQRMLEEEEAEKKREDEESAGWKEKEPSAVHIDSLEHDNASLKSLDIGPSEIISSSLPKTSESAAEKERY